MAKNFKFINWFNRQVSNIRNNRFSNWIKDLFVGYSGIPLFLYTDVTSDYVAEILDTDEVGVVEVTLVNVPTYAKDCKSLWWFQRNTLLKKVNKAFEQDPEKRTFRFRRVLIYTTTAGK